MATLKNFMMKGNTETSLRIGECRLSYAYLFAPRKNEDGSQGKYSVQLLIPKANTAAKEMIDAAIEAAKQIGVQTKWNGKMPPAARLATPLRDGDAEFPDDDNYEGMWFMNTSASPDFKPGLRVISGGQLVEAMDEEDIYSGCYGAVMVNFYPYSVSGNNGVAAGLNSVVKTNDGEKLSGTHNVDNDFADLVGDDASVLD